jgi:hypothetical protein
VNLLPLDLVLAVVLIAVFFRFLRALLKRFMPRPGSPA